LAGPSPVIFQLISVIVLGVILPVVLIPIVQLLGFSEVAEELAKALVVGAVILGAPTFSSKLGLGVLFGLLFGVSESMFYANQLFQLGDPAVFYERLLFTVPMHVISVLIMVLGAHLGKKWGLLLGLIIALCFHLAFNAFVSHGT
jgi:hypothetical protein